MASEQISLVVDRIYDAALDPAQWTALLGTIGRLVGAPQGSLMMGSAGEPTMTDFGYGRNEEAIALYNTHFLGQDPWFKPLVFRGVGAVATGQELLSTREFENTAYYQECMKVDDTYDCLAVILESGRDANAFVAFQRPEVLPLFAAREKAMLKLLVPHLRRVVRVHRQLGDFFAKSSLQTYLLDRLPFGVIIVSSTGGVEFISSAAKKLGGDGLMLTRDGIVAIHPEDNRKLANAQRCALAHSSSDGHGARGSTVEVRRPSMKRPYIVQVMPLNPGSSATARIFGGRTTSRAVITITDPERQHVPPSELLMQLYHLTRAEAELALKIASGIPLKEAAERLSISWETARWHMKSVLAKTDTGRQLDLVSLLLKLRSPLSNGE